MSTVPLTHPGAGPQARPAEGVRARKERAPSLLAGALLLVILYTAFSHGAVALATEARTQVAVDAIVLLAGAAWLWSGVLTLGASRMAALGAASLAGFVIWCGITVLWSVAPNQTWIELNRAVTYVLALGLAISLGSSTRRAAELIADGFLLAALAVTAYALGQKLFPGLHVSGLFDLNQAGQLPRLQEPLGYWNALALFIAYGVPAALVRAVDLKRSVRARIAALIAVQLMLLTIGLTYSRGGLIALVAGLAVGIALGGVRLRSIMWIALAVLAALPPLIAGLASHSLSAANVALGQRESAGAILFGLLLVCSGAMGFGARRLQTLEARSNLEPDQTRRVARGLVGIVAAAIVVGLLAVTFSSRGLTGTASHAWHSFTTTRTTSTYDPERLLSANSENRWVWWKEAAGAFSDRPIAGWGAGSFGVVHLLYRRDRLSVSQPHSVPLQFLSETGLIGGVLALLAFGLLLTAAIRGVKRRPAGRDRMVRAALLAGVVMFLVHCLYDWDWDIPAVTLPALVFLGVLSGTPGRVRSLRAGMAVRGFALAALTLGVCVIVISDVLPSLAASKASDAIVGAAGSASSVQAAQATAVLASRLDPLSDAGLLAEATIAARRGQREEVRSLLISATRRDPTDSQAWWQLAFAEYNLGDLRAVAVAAKRAVELDPLSANTTQLARSLSHSVTTRTASPSLSATAQPLRGG